MDYENLIERLRGYCQEWEAYRREQYRHDLEDAAAALTTLQAENTKLRAELEAVRAEMDAAVSDLRRLGDCATCIHDKLIGYDDKPCTCCARGEKWEWRGLEKGEQNEAADKTS